MRTSQYFLATVKEAPNDAVLASHQLMVRAGLIYKLASGLYSWLPTGLRVLQKVEKIVREEMNGSDAIEIFLPHVSPAELWQETGRWDKYGHLLLKIKDRHDRDFCFGPTHEEVFTDIARKHIHSYKQLPVNLYQIQTKFRDEIRPRFGLMRAREFMMKDAYSFHLDQASQEETYEKMYTAYTNILKRLGLTFRAVQADSGDIGGSRSHEFQVLAKAGEDDVFYSDQSDYAANVEKASALLSRDKRDAASKPLKVIDTPGQYTIDDLAKFLKCEASALAKTIIIKDADDKYFALILRGDHTLNEVKVTNLAQVSAPFRFAGDQEIKDLTGANPGSIGPVALNIPVIVDKEADLIADFSCGANEDDKHYIGVNWDRDITEYTVEDIRNVQIGDKSPDGQGTLQHAKGIEVGHIFQLSDVYSSKMNATVLDQNGKAQNMIMGCYGFGVSRVLAAAIEQNHDENGIIWPEAMAPFQVCIVPIQYHKSDLVKQEADKLYDALTAQGIEVLLDDRNERPGVMFNEMDLIGVSHRIVLGDRSLKNGTVEYKARTSDKTEDWALGECIEKILNLIK